MAYLERNARLRAPNLCAKTTLRTRVVDWLQRTLKLPVKSHVADLDERLLRDIGYTSADVAQLKHRLPTERAHHPYW